MGPVRPAKPNIAYGLQRGYPESFMESVTSTLQGRYVSLVLQQPPAWQSLDHY